MPDRRGLFVTFEGTEGVGKSTQIDLAARSLDAAGCRVCRTREPGGTAAGEAIREVLLHRDGMRLDAEAELLLMFAARAQHLAEVIRPALRDGEVVLCDRFTDATFAYQGGGRGIDPGRIRALADWVHPGLAPDLTVLLDAPVEVGLARVRARGGGDRFESESDGFFQRVRAAYLSLAEGDPERFVVVNAERPAAAVNEDVSRAIRERLPT